MRALSVSLGWKSDKLQHHKRQEFQRASLTLPSIRPPPLTIPFQLCYFIHLFFCLPLGFFLLVKFTIPLANYIKLFCDGLETAACITCICLWNLPPPSKKKAKP